MDRLTTFGHEHVRDLQQILCFPWVSGSEIAGDLQPAPALTLTFLKLDEELIAKEGLGVEHDAVHSLQRWIHKGGRSGALNGLVLGSLGWPELLLMLTGSDLGELLNVARDLATTPIQRRNKPDLRFTFSHTLPCVRWAGNGKRFATESVDGQVSCQVLVSARPEHLGQVIRTVRDLPHSVSVEGAHEATVPLWDTEVAFGRRDLLVTPRDRHPVNIDRVVHLLAVLRSTESDHQSGDGEGSETGAPAPLITATQLLMGTTPLPPVPIVPHEVRESYDDFEEIANLFFYGLDQRLAGAVFGVSNPARAYTHLHALGVQRILCAADAIPRALLRLVRSYDGALEWPGFVVFGYCDETAKLVFNVLNMPYQDVALPSEWWRLAHEAGHACVDLQSFSDLSGFRALEQQLKHSDLTDIAEDPAHLLDELAANVFEFEFAFR